MLEITRGSFSIKSAWHYIRHKEEENIIYNCMCTKGVPFEIHFDDRVRKWGVEGPSKCRCCERPQQETLAHVFLKSYSANRIWSYFWSFAALNMDGLQLREVIMLWWRTDVWKNMRHFYRALPIFLI